MTSINRTGHRIPSVRKSCTKKQDTGTSPDGSGNSVPDTSRASETGTSRNKIPRKQTVHLQHVQKQEIKFTGYVYVLCWLKHLPRHCHWGLPVSFLQSAITLTGSRYQKQRCSRNCLFFRQNLRRRQTGLPH